MHLSAPVSRTAEAIDSGASTTAAVYESLGRPDYIAKVSDQGTTFYYFKIRIDTFRSDPPWRFDFPCCPGSWWTTVFCLSLP